ncbi:hypothetical protein E2C01_060757 [Portunus trituberculatus]|uniref:Uncharacterized protein n=1 Tax=Portunus trituberculatus TaxID=210409 RepID=A0A5B7HBF4_PORTR|nr:hypothetical protein [Portunus trituberculatus]
MFQNTPVHVVREDVGQTYWREERGTSGGDGRETSLRGGSASVQGHVLSREKTGSRAKQHTSNHVVIASSSLTSRPGFTEASRRPAWGGGRKGKSGWGVGEGEI